MIDPVFIPDKEHIKNMSTKTEKYRKVTRTELESLGLVLPTDKYKEHIAFARKYYPKEATSLVLSINSEYNDNTYDNRLQYVIAYNKDGDELLPLKETAKECRQKWYELSIPGMGKCGYASQEQINDIVIPLLDRVPELYTKS